MKNNKTSYIIVFLFILTMVSCIEPFDPVSITYENILVVEGRLTNENKRHIIKLSRTFRIDTTGVLPEKNANVYVIDYLNTINNFTEIENGIYQSVNTFTAEPNKTYILKIETESGEIFTSAEEKLTATSQLNDITASTEINNLDETLINMSIQSYNPNNDAKYYKYEYEETYKIIAPYWSYYDLEVYYPTPLDPYMVRKIPRTIDNKICYKTQRSNKIIQTETASLSEDRVVNFPVRSFSNSDFIISHRYSILVKQYVQSFNAYNYYQTLQKFSSTDNVFSESQVGFLQGNISLESNPNTKVIGYFEVCSVSSKRVFYNREDLTYSFPSFPDECHQIKPVLYDEWGSTPLLNFLDLGYIYFANNQGPADPFNPEGPYILVKKICGDCTVLGSNIKPDFWID